MIETATDTLVKRLLHPDDFGWSVTAEVRDTARVALRSTRYDLYLCGPMTGKLHLNHPAFRFAHADLTPRLNRRIAMTDYKEILDALAHEIWAAAKLAPGEGIIQCVGCRCDRLDNGLNPVGCPYCKEGKQ